ncbi:MAG: aldo/keto reductase [Gammaproteobacteria bacterium]
MHYRQLGNTRLRISETGFGAWPIGGASYGQVNKAESLRAAAVAEELGCNFIDTAEVYGDSELVIGEFLRGRRDKWVVATKFSNAKDTITAAVERQLKRLNTDVIDLYQIHWVPRAEGKRLFDELYRVKRDGKVRFVGVSLYNLNDIDFVIDHTELDTIQLPCNLLEPLPYLPRLNKIQQSGLGVIIRSSLKGGFLTGKYTRDSQFCDSQDQRSKLSRDELNTLLDQVEAMRFLEQEAGSLALAAARFPLSFASTSTVLLGTKTEAQARFNFGEIPGGKLSEDHLQQIHAIQKQLGLYPPAWQLWLQALKNKLKS